MKKTIAWGAAGLLWASLLPGISAANAEPVQPGPVKIALMGDALTQGTAGDYTWRYFLWKHLQKAGASVDFVGPRNTLDVTWTSRDSGIADSVLAQSYADPDFDRDHASDWSTLMNRENVLVADVMNNHAPDVLVYAVGTSDLIWEKWSPRRVVDGIKARVDAARAVNPDVDVVVSQLMLDQDALSAFPIDEVNALIKAEAPAWATATSKIAVAELPSDFRYTRDTVDMAGDTWNHLQPDTSGQVKLGAAYADALASISVGASPARPLSFPAEGPVGKPAVTVESRLNGGLATWTPVAGASSYDVWISRGGGAFAEVAREVEGREYEFASLAPGVSYQVKVYARSWRVRAAESSASNAATFTPQGTVVKPPVVTPPAPKATISSSCKPVKSTSTAKKRVRAPKICWVSSRAEGRVRVHWLKADVKGTSIAGYRITIGGKSVRVGASRRGVIIGDLRSGRAVDVKVTVLTKKGTTKSSTARIRVK